MTFVITIVHGTVPFRWLTDGLARLRLRAPTDPAPWARRDAPLCKGLVEALPGRVFFSDFFWSGANSAGARAEAADSLRLHLEDLIDRHPKARQVVVAHSHGGNITLHALRSDAMSKHLRGVVCLSTPFITVVERAGWILPSFIALLYLSALLDVIAAVAIWSAYDWFASLSFWWRAMSIPLLAVLFFSGVGLLASRVVSAAYHLATSWKKRVALPDVTWLGRDRLLIIKGAADEANSFLGSAQFAAWGAGGLIRRAAILAISFHDKIESPFRNARNSALKWAGMAGCELLLLCVLMLAGLILWPVMATLMCISMATWGVWLGLLSPLIELSAESTPPGTWQITQFVGFERGTWVDLFGTELATLAHSTVYADARAIKEITDWIAKGEAAEQVEEPRAS